jgi:probable addiction module antidote protein
MARVSSKSSKTRTTPYDVAEHLRTPEEMAAYLDAWLEEAPDDVSGIAKALGDIARAKGMTQVAMDAGLSRESLYRALSANGNPSFATVLKVARALGVKFQSTRGHRLRVGAWRAFTTLTAAAAILLSSGCSAGCFMKDPG